jgi:hypothetical protein
LERFRPLVPRSGDSQPPGALPGGWQGGDLAEFERSHFPRSPAEIWRQTLGQISTRFGRLVFLASLRDGQSGRYTHALLLNYMTEEEADRTIRHSHHQVFQQWLFLSLGDQKSDLDQYLSENQAPRYSLPYRNLTPSAALEVERQLYLTDLETLLELLRYEPGGAFATTPKA